MLPVTRLWGLGSCLDCQADEPPELFPQGREALVLSREGQPLEAGRGFSVGILAQPLGKPTRSRSQTSIQFGFSLALTLLHFYTYLVLRHS